MGGLGTRIAATGGHNSPTSLCISSRITSALSSIHAAHLPLQYSSWSSLESTSAGVLLAAFFRETRVHSLWPTGGDTRFEMGSHPLPAKVRKLAVSAISGHERLYISLAGVLMGML